MQVRSKKYILLISFAISALVLVFSGCVRNAVAPGSASTNQVERVPLPADLAEIQRLLPNGAHVLASQNPMRVLEDAYTESIVNPSAPVVQGVIVENCGVKFPVGTLPGTLLATVYVDNKPYPAVEYGPHNIGFNGEVTIEISYANHYPLLASTSLLQIFYWNEALRRFEPIRSEIDREHRIVRGYTTHFSYYLISGVDEMIESW
ncbi:MAG: hypothetical protein OEM52_13140 [bacterium]|nr:hypothetical protein [bacterium]